MNAASKPIILGVVLAGGRSSRMQSAFKGDKFLLHLGGNPLIKHVVESLTPQVSELVITYNGDRNRFSFPCEYKLIEDYYEGSCGPIAGILSAYHWAINKHYSFDYLLAVPADAVGIPSNLAAQLLESVSGNDSTRYACSGEDPLYTISLWQKDALKLALNEFSQGERALRKVLWSVEAKGVQIETGLKHPVLNINNPEQFAQAKALIKE